MLHRKETKIKRKNIRLSKYDYSNEGLYFITVCTKDKNNYFGNIVNEEMSLSEIGNIVLNNINKLEKIYKFIKIDKFVIMPNHIHLIIIIKDKNERTLSIIIKKYKEWVTKQIKETIWQKSFYDHIIRNEKDYLRIWEYIDENILKWSLDKYYNE